MKFMKKDGKDIEGERCIKGKNGKLVSVKNREKSMEKSHGKDYE